MLAGSLAFGLGLGCGSAIAPWEPADDGIEPGGIDAEVSELDARVPDTRVPDAHIRDASVQDALGDAEDDADEPDAGDASPFVRGEEYVDCPVHNAGTIVRARTVETPASDPGAGGGPVGLVPCGDGSCLLRAANASGSQTRQSASQLFKLDVRGREVWRQSFLPDSITARFYPTDLAAGPDGTLTVGGACLGQINLPHRSQDAAQVSCNSDEAELLLLHLRADGTVDWTRKLGESGSDPHALEVAVSADGRVFASGAVWDRTIGVHALITSFTVSGSPLYERVVSGGRTVPTALVVDDDGSVVIAGSFAGPLLTFTIPGADAGVALAQASVLGCLLALDPAGDLDWSRCFSGNVMFPAQLAADTDGSLVLAGSFTGGLNLAANEGLPDAGSLDAGASFDALLARFGRDGSLQWQRQLGDQGFQNVGVGLVTTPAHAIYLALNSSTDVSPGDGLPVLHGSRHHALGFDSAGHAFWSAPFGQADSMIGSESMLEDRCGNLLFASSYSGWLYAATGEADRPEGLVVGSLSLPAR